MCRIQWRKLSESFLIWLSIELVLNVIGMDDLADYAEFRLVRQRISSPQSPEVQMVDVNANRDLAIPILEMETIQKVKEQQFSKAFS